MSNFSDIKSELIGKSIEAALKLIKDAGLKHRVCAENGVTRELTMDYREDRVNLSVNNGVVSDAYNG